MTRLTHQQWSQLNRFVLELHDEVSEENYFRCTVEALPKLLGVTWLAWQELDVNYHFGPYRVSKDYEVEVPKYTEQMENTMESHPVVKGLGLLARTAPIDGVYISSDFVSHHEMRELPIYREAYRHVDIRHQIYAELVFTPEIRTGLTINSDRPISEEQRLLTELAKGHLTLAYKNILKLKSSAPRFSEQGSRYALFAQFTPRQQEVLGHLLNGLSRKLIADEMNLSIHTLNDHVRGIYAKLNVHSHAEMMALFAKG